jgi:hypothetical protein
MPPVVRHRNGAEEERGDPAHLQYSSD